MDGYSFHIRNLHSLLSTSFNRRFPKVPDDQLVPLTAKFRKVLISEQKIWAIGYSDINVLNESKAIKYGLIARKN